MPERIRRYLSGRIEEYEKKLQDPCLKLEDRIEYERMVGKLKNARKGLKYKLGNGEANLR